MLTEAVDRAAPVLYMPIQRSLDDSSRLEARLEERNSRRNIAELEEFVPEYAVELSIGDQLVAENTAELSPHSNAESRVELLLDEADSAASGDGLDR